MDFPQLQSEFVRFDPKSDADRAAQLIVSRLRSPDEVRSTYQVAPDLFHSMSPRLNTLMFRLLGLGKDAKPY